MLAFWNGERFGLIRSEKDLADFCRYACSTIFVNYRTICKDVFSALVEDGLTEEEAAEHVRETILFNELYNELSERLPSGDNKKGFARGMVYCGHFCGVPFEFRF